MICLVKPVLTEDMYIVHNEEFSMACCTISDKLDTPEVYSYEANPSFPKRMTLKRDTTAGI
jgi:hypothetical protein